MNLVLKYKKVFSAQLWSLSKMKWKWTLIMENVFHLFISVYFINIFFIPFDFW